MNVHLVRSHEFDTVRFWEIFQLLNKYPGVVRFKTNEQPVIIDDEDIKKAIEKKEDFNIQFSLSKDFYLNKSSFEVESVSWNTLFLKCKQYRLKHDIGNDEIVILLTDYSNDKNWFSASDPDGTRNIFIQTKYWDYFAGSDLRYPVVYLVISGILKLLMFDDYHELTANWHEKPIGCMMDFCKNKMEISFKLRTGDICFDCLKIIDKKGVDHAIVQQSFHILDEIRSQMLFKGRFVINKKPPLLKIEGRTKKIIFPDLGNLEIGLTPLEKTVYLFFMNYPYGIRLNTLFEFKEELFSIYSSLSNSDNNETMKKRIEDLIDPLSNSTSEKISRIKKKFYDALGEEIGKLFCITGDNAEPKRIPYLKLEN